LNVSIKELYQMKRSILTFSLVIALLMTACGGGATPAVEAPVQPGTDGAADGAAPVQNSEPKLLGQQFTVRYGQTVVLEDGTTISFDSVAEDSRCAPDVECAQAGQVAVNLTLTVAGAAQPIAVIQATEDAVDTVVGGYTVKLLEVRPKSVPAATEEYRLKVVVTKP
jgi:hypothetical protein